jgi:hypothetical protein
LYTFTLVASGRLAPVESGRPDARGVGIVGIGRDALAQLVVRALQLRVITVDVLASEPEQLLVVGSLEPMSARTVDDSHHALLSGLYAFTVVPRAPYFSALRRVSSNAERA